MQKIYMIYNKVSEQLIGEMFTCHNDREAEYRFSVDIAKTKESNKYFREEDFQLVCLGILEREKCVGILNDLDNDYPVKFDEIKYGWKPKHESEYYKDITEPTDKYMENLKNMQGVK